jgi:hypothetical protein
MVPTGPQKRSFIAEPRLFFKTQDIAVKGHGAVKVGDPQVNMSDARVWLCHALYSSSGPS